MTLCTNEGKFTSDLCPGAWDSHNDKQPLIGSSGSTPNASAHFSFNEIIEAQWNVAAAAEIRLHVNQASAHSHSSRSPDPQHTDAFESRKFVKNMLHLQKTNTCVLSPWRRLSRSVAGGRCD